MIVIGGLTSTGKTTIGLSLAKKLGGEIVSADSRQVYELMDIGTGKDIGRHKFIAKNGQLNREINSRLNQKLKIGIYKIGGVPIWGLDLVKPNQQFSVAQYSVFAATVIKDIWRRGRLPFLIGGTGFYLKSVISSESIETLGIPPNWELRWRFKDLPPTELLKKLDQLDPLKAAALNFSDRQNSRRLIRAIEIAMFKEKPENLPNLKNLRLKPDQLVIIFLTAPNRYLYGNIDRRVRLRVKAGMEREIKKLLRSGYNWQNSAMGVTLGYKEWQYFFGKELSCKELIERWQYDEHAFARRQLTWFKKFYKELKKTKKPVYWVDVSKKNWQRKIEKLAGKLH